MVIFFSERAKERKAEEREQRRAEQTKTSRDNQG